MSEVHCAAGTPRENTLEVNILRFILMLRQAGVRVSSSEALDAVKALTLIDLAQPSQVRAALRGTLVKKAAEVALFDRIFDMFFAPEEQRHQRLEAWQEQKGLHRQKLEQAGQELEFLGKQLSMTEQEMTVYANIPEQEKERLKNYMDKTAGGKNVEEPFRPLLESVVKGSLSYWRKQLKEDLDLTPPPDTGDEELDSILSQAEGTGSGGRKGVSLLQEDMQNIADKDLPRAGVILGKLARQLISSISRRYRRSRRHQKLDLRRTIRDNLQYGGTLFHLKYKSRRQQKPRLLLLCDVSGSMARYSSFVLQFIYSINAVVSHIESFVFADHLENITPHFARRQDFDATMVEVINKSRQWGGGTSIAAALTELQEKFEEALKGNTVVLIVSDTKTVNLDKALVELRRLRRRVKDVIWLNTLPEEERESLRTARMIGEEVRMFPCNTLADLEDIVRKRVLS